MALFTLDELGYMLQDDALDEEAATLARQTATALVQAVTGPLEATTSTVVLPVTVAGMIDLPGTAITAVTAVTVDDVAVEFSWRRPFPQVRIKDWTPPSTLDEWPVAEVTYSHGYAVVPPVAKAVALSVAGRIYSNPNGAMALRIDDYSEQYQPTAAGASLTEYELAALRPLTATAWVTP